MESAAREPETKAAMRGFIGTSMKFSSGWAAAPSASAPSPADEADAGFSSSMSSISFTMTAMPRATTCGQIW